ncbi:MAG: ABC transporter permease [Candidatus Eisenbacteria bacterium]
MILGEFVGLALGNLRRTKLRSALTIAGVAVGVGSLVAMLSFAFGVERNVTGEFEKMGLLRTLQVTPASPQADSLDGEPPVLDAAVLDRIAAIPGVSFAYPQHAFDARIRWDGREEEGRVQALPAGFSERRSVGKMVAGRFFASDSVPEAVVSRSWIRRREIPADSILGRSLTLQGAGVPEVGLVLFGKWLVGRGVPPESAGRLVRIGEKVLGGTRGGACEVRVVGVAEMSEGLGFRLGDVLVPPGVLAGRDFLSFSNPIELAAMLESPLTSGWPMLVVTLESERDRERVRGEIEAAGFRVFDFLERFADLRRGFLVMDALAGVVGFIAIFVAALGITNTLVMSILERTREIGILKSLGAEDRDIRRVFLVESAAIGAIGSCAGLLLGWGVSRLASALFQGWMATQDVLPLDVFHLPVWAAAAAILFGIAVSVAAGFYPSGRAARVDPVQALRGE